MILCFLIPDEPVELPKFDVTWLAIDDGFKLMHVKVMRPGDLQLADDVEVQFLFLWYPDRPSHCLASQLHA